MGTLYRRGNRLYIGFKDAEGKWHYRASGFGAGEEEQAKKLLARLEARTTAAEEHRQASRTDGPLTLVAFAQTWLANRRKLGLSDWQNDEARLAKHVLPRIGDMLLADVRPRHLITLFEKLRTDGALAPKTIHNIYSVLKSMFRSAQLKELIDTTPCILTKYELGENRDKDPEWRPTALFSRVELEALLSDPRIPADRQVLYALEGLGALRHGEAAGLRWRHWDTALEPLTGLVIATSYDKGETKTKRSRIMPVHPTLAELLTGWKQGGWAQMMGRAPEPDDLMVPMPKGPKNPLGKMRNKEASWRRLGLDLDALGLRHRRGHDLRRTMISLARTDGARKDVLELCTHTPGTGGAIDLYTTFPWEARCAEVAKLRIARVAHAPAALESAQAPSPAAVSQAAQVSEKTSSLTTALLQSQVTTLNRYRKMVTPPGIEPGSST